MLHTLDTGKWLGTSRVRPFFVVQSEGNIMPRINLSKAEKQAVEINRIRKAVGEFMHTLTPIHPREGSIALLVICIEMMRHGSSMNDRQIREELADMVKWLMENTIIVSNKDIN